MLARDGKIFLFRVFFRHGNCMTNRIKIVAGITALLLIGGATGLHLMPPELLRVGANYSAKIICSNVFLTQRDAQQVLADDVQTHGHPLLKYMQVNVDREHKLVRANLFGFIGGGLAVYRPGTGCAAVPDGDVSAAAGYQFERAPLPAPPGDLAWPRGLGAEGNATVESIVADDALAGPGMRGIVVIHQGKLLAQRYAKGFNETTPLLGWSMTKSVTAALIGMQVKAGKLKLDQAGFWPDPARGAIKLADLMAMSSGLHFNEEYGDVSDVTRMLYQEADMASYVHAQPLEHAPGSTWSYSSGTTVLLSRLWQDAVGNAALSYPHDQLFAPLGMRSAILEADARGNMVGSSYMYATAQDWARFGQFLLQDGVWNDNRLLPEGFVAMMSSAASASHGQYGQGQVWRWGPYGNTPAGQNPDTPFHLPADTYWMQGHDGQSVAIIPSKQLVVVRLGLTPHRLFYQPQALVAAIANTLN
jgi:CubicO group peptidase (beta-lactamase class C family)